MFVYFLFYLATRLVNLTALPLFNDEAFFLWVGSQIRQNPQNNLFLNFSDGKEPLFFWVYSLFPGLLGIRLLSVFFGFLTFILFIKICRRFLSDRGQFIAVVLYLFSPFLLFYQRLGMQETLLTFLLTAVVWFYLQNSKILLGIFIALSLLTKSSALAFLIFLLPYIIIKKNFRSLLIAAIIYFPIAIIGFNAISSHNSSYVGIISPEQILTNFKQLIKWLIDYQGLPLTILGLPAILPAIVESLVAKIFFPRYFLFCAPFFILFAAKIIDKIHRQNAAIFTFVLILFPNVFLTLQIIFNVTQAKLPYIERWQYLESWPSGFGIKETAGFLEQNQAQTIVVEDIMITRYGLSYYHPKANYQVGGIGDYYVFSRQSPTDKSLVLKFSYPKVGNHEEITVWSTQ